MTPGKIADRVSLKTPELLLAGLSPMSKVIGDSQASLKTLRSLVRLLSDTDRLSNSLDKFAGWTREILETSLTLSGYTIAGGILVKSICSETSEPFYISPLISEAGNCIPEAVIGTVSRDLIDQFKSADSDHVARAMPCSHQETHLILQAVQIRDYTDKCLYHSAGVLWAIGEKNQTRDTLTCLKAAASLLLLAASSRLARKALADMTSPAWNLQQTTDARLRSFGNALRTTLACTTVTIWEIDYPARVLRTLLTLGLEEDDLALDMRLGSGAAGTVALDSKILRVADMQNPEELRPYGISNIVHEVVAREKELHAAIFIPIDIGHKNVAVVAALDKRPGFFTPLHETIAQALAQRLAADYINARRLDALRLRERKLEKEATAIEAGILAIEGVHDADNDLIRAQSALSEITTELKKNPRNRFYRAASAASKNIDSAHKLLRRLVVLARNPEPRLRPEPLEGLLKAVIQPMEVQAEAVGAAISVSCPPYIMLRCDKKKIERVLQNLVGNAIFFLERDTKAQKRKINVEVIREKEGVVILVTDNGPGIAPHDIERIFDFFYTTKGHRGMGFGLGIAKALMAQHKGEIVVSSEWGYETRFRLYFPD